MTNQTRALNPLIGVSIGSTVLGNSFKPSVINASITKMITQKEVVKELKGYSSYVYSDSLNEVSAGVSGAYGVSGISKLTSALSFFAGRSEASSSKSINIDYDVSMISGIEYINFDDLTAEDLLNSLSKGPKDMVLTILDNFNLIKKASSKDKSKLINNWLMSLNGFQRAYGDGIVVGVIWGGTGGVSMEMTSDYYQDNWRYGQSADFTYSSTGSAVSIGETYNGGQTDNQSSVKSSCKSWSNGECVEEQINQWFDLVANKSFYEICDIKFLDSAPKPSTVSVPPKIPEFHLPIKDSKVEQKLVELGTIGDTTELAIEAGFNAAQQSSPNISKQEFISKTKEKNNVAALDKIIDSISANKIDVLKETKKSNATTFHRDSIMLSKQSGHAALGVWIANWSSVFPWMSMGYLNEIVETSDVEALLQKRCMLNDLTTLSNIYYSLNSCELNLDFTMFKSALQVADVFSSSFITLRDNIEDPDIIKKVFNAMNTHCQSIYKKWNELKFLRGAELGFGILVNKNSSVSSEISGLTPFPYPEVSFKTKDCLYSTGGEVVFSSFLKVLTFIDSNGDIYAFGPASMLLKNTGNNSVSFTKGGYAAKKFKIDQSNNRLFSDGIELIPVGYKAAKGVNWKGMGVGKSISSNLNTNDQLKNLRKELSNINACTLSSDLWDENWSYDKAFNIRNISTSYLGCIDSVGTIFNAAVSDRNDVT